jgi:hypothetical protein
MEEELMVTHRFCTEEERDEFLLLNGLYLNDARQVLDTRGEIVGRIDSLLVVDLQEVGNAWDNSSLLPRTSQPDEEPTLEDAITTTSRSRLLAMTTRFNG